MKILVLLVTIFISGCGFTPLYSTTQNKNVCVEPIPEHEGYIIYQQLKNRFTGIKDCQYTLRVSTPVFKLSDAGISDHSFTTTQRINVKATYTLFNKDKKKVLSSSAEAEGSSSIIDNPYASVVARETNEQNLLPILANSIETHVSTFLLRNNQ